MKVSKLYDFIFHIIENTEHESSKQKSCLKDLYDILKMQNASKDVLELLENFIKDGYDEGVSLPDVYLEEVKKTDGITSDTYKIALERYNNKVVFTRSARYSGRC